MLYEDIWLFELQHFAISHHEDPVTVHYCSDPMSDG